MLDLIREGGGPMLFVLIFGLLTFATAGLFAARGDRRRLGFIVAMGVATLLSVGHHGLGRCAEKHIDAQACLLMGFAESMAPAIMGLTLLSLAAMLVAVGMSRTARALPPA